MEKNFLLGADCFEDENERQEMQWGGVIGLVVVFAFDWCVMGECAEMQQTKESA